MLEVVESDFAKDLAGEESTESSAQSDYEKISQENQVTKTMKDQDAKYQNQELKSLAQTLSELNNDYTSASSESAAVLEYYAQIKDRCIAKPEAYAVRKQRRDAEIQGLKEALSVLEDETAFVQRKRRGGNFRGTLAAH